MPTSRDAVVEHALGFRLGGMVRAELEALRDLCGARNVVELGSYVGMSSYVIGSVCRELVCVDLWPASWEFLEDAQRVVYEGQAHQVGDLAVAWALNVRPVRGRITALRLPTVEAAAHVDDGWAEVLLVDADHSEAAVAADLAAWLPKVKPDGLVLLHDYASSWPGVAAAAKAAPIRLVGRVASMGIFVKEAA